MTSKEQGLQILKTLSAIEGILRSHSRTSTIPDCIWDEVANITKILSDEILESDSPVQLPDCRGRVIIDEDGECEIAWRGGMPPDSETNIYTEEQVRALLAQAAHAVEVDSANGADLLPR